MLTKDRYTFKELFQWTRYELAFFISYNIFIVIAYKVLHFDFLVIPWAPLALVGTAVSFLVGFQNNSAYERVWEARKIWGGIVNDSRSWASLVQASIKPQEALAPSQEDQSPKLIHELIYRHLAWLTALRYAMRTQRSWEPDHQHTTDQEWLQRIYTPEFREDYETSLTHYLEESEYHSLKTVDNMPSAILYRQAQRVSEIQEMGYLWEFSNLELQKIIHRLYALQGKSERIKNFPYPRQYAGLSRYIVLILNILLPFGVIPQFYQMLQQLPIPSNLDLFWLSAPLSALISWVFYTMERIGRSTENPFTGSPNDVPISNISRSIEINLLQMIEDPNIPKAFPQPSTTQM